jgi:hypothetical protein
MDNEGEFIRAARSNGMPEWWIVNEIIFKRILATSAPTDVERAERYRLTGCQVISGMSYKEWDNQLDRIRPLPYSLRPLPLRIAVEGAFEIPLDDSEKSVYLPPGPPGPIDLDSLRRMFVDESDEDFLEF